MATPATFQKAEDEFFLLRGKLQARRITREQFDIAVKGLTIQDDQGRYWTIGGNTGKWYVHDGRVWVEASPPGTLGSPDLLPPPPEATRSQGSIPLVLVGFGLVVVLALCGAIGLFFVSSQDLLRISLGSPTNTPAPVIALPTLPAPFTPVVLVVTSTPLATATPTLAEPTAPPTATRSSTPPPTAPPTATPSSTPVPPTVTPSSTPAPPTATRAFPSATIWPGLFVAGVQLDPPEPKDRQTPTFKVTFLNTLGQTVQYRWFIKIFRPEQKQSFGETAKLNSDIPPGTTVLAAVPNWKGVAGEPCNAFTARVFYQAPDNTILEFPKPGGDTFAFYFWVCQ
jgi:hypothetical protein